MKVTIFVEPGRIALDEKPISDVLFRVTTITICGKDGHIMKGGKGFLSSTEVSGPGCTLLAFCTVPTDRKRKESSNS